MARNEKTTYVLVLPDGREYFTEGVGLLNGADLTNHANEAVCHLKLKTSRSKAEKITFKTFRLVVEKGQQKRIASYDITVNLPLEAMNEQEYEQEMENLLADIPNEFREYIRSEAWDQGHANGYDECFGIATNLYYALKKVVDTYTARITNKC